jgi:Fe-S cluster biogenesis protein NfuA
MIPIRAEPQADPGVCRFVIEGGQELLSEGSYLCRDAGQAQGAPLLESLFAIDGLSQAWIAGNSVTVQKSSDAPWTDIGKQVGTVLRAHLDSGRKFVPPVAAKNAGSSSALAERIRTILDTQVNPGVAGHGGRIELIDIQGGRVFLKMSGGCQGCGAAKVTLKQGVEKTLRALIPEITEVVDVTDHSAGANPYYAR